MLFYSVSFVLQYECCVTVREIYSMSVALRWECRIVAVQMKITVLLQYEGSVMVRMLYYSTTVVLQYKCFTV